MAVNAKMLTSIKCYVKLQLQCLTWLCFLVLAKKISIQTCFFASVRKCQWSFNFLQKQMLGKNLVLELWSKNHKTNQNAWFFKLHYVTNNKLRWEVKFFDVTIGPWEQQMLVGCCKWVWLGTPWHVQNYGK